MTIPLSIVAASVMIGFIQAQECDEKKAKYIQQKAHCNGSLKTPKDPSAFCAEPSCKDQLRLYEEMYTICSLKSSELTMINDSIYISPYFCRQDCLESYIAMKSLVAQCHDTSSTRIGTTQCLACQKYIRTIPTLVSSCQYNSTVHAMKTMVENELRTCDQSVRNDNGVDGSGNISPFLISGLAVGILFLGFALFMQKRRQRLMHVFQTMTYRKKGKKSSGAYTEYAIQNDIRYDPTMARFWHPQNKLSQITLRSKGGFGMVFSATLDTQSARGKIHVAIKQLLPEKAQDAEHIEQFMNEIRLAALLKHPNIVPFVGLTWSSLQDISMITEYMANGDLHKLLRTEFKKAPGKRSLSWSVETNCNKLTIAANVMDALAYLHAFTPCIIHRDLKSKNVLLGDTYLAHLTDFGVSRQSATDIDAIMTARVGTSAWIAPEVLRGEKYTQQADMYSYGVLLSELDTLQEPYKDATLQPELAKLSPGKIASKVAHGKLVPAFSSSVPSYIMSIATKCLSYDYTQRPSATQVAMEMNSFLIQDHQRLSHYLAKSYQDGYSAL